MQRDIEKLVEARLDILVVGGGVYGAALVREAATRGLRAGLIEQKDFCSGSSANSLKIMHGGLRYLQQMDLPRVLESIRERSIWLRTAPHLVEPLTCMMPTRASLLRNRGVMALGMALNDLLSWRRNRAVDPIRRIASCRTISKASCLERLPALQGRGVTGGAVWHDAVGVDTERLVISMLLDACDAGACVANYVTARGLRFDGNAVVGVAAEDALTGATFDIGADVVINAVGPWSAEFLQNESHALTVPCRHLALGINLILKRGPSVDLAAGLTAGPSTASGGRLFFFVPWRDAVLAGTYYRSHEGPLSDVKVTDEDVAAYLEALNSCYPGLDLTTDDILMVHAGVLPVSHAPQAGKEPPLLRHYKLIDHGNADGVEGLFSVLGVKYTTARDVAQHAIAVAETRVNCPVVPSTSATRPLPGDVVGSLTGFRDASIRRYAKRLPQAAIERLLTFYGSGIDGILARREPDDMLPGSDDVTQHEIRHVIAHEMPQTLGDLIFRRTGLGSRSAPHPELLRACGRIMAEMRGWDDERLTREVESVEQVCCLWRAATR